MKLSKTITDGVYTNLWFDSNAREAVDFYLSIFEDSKKLSENNMVITFELQGRTFSALNGGPLFRFNEAMSLVVNCKNQQELDYYWEKLGDGGEFSMCGWLKDKFGVSWQILPENLDQLLYPEDNNKAQRAKEALLKMQKIDIEMLKMA